MGGILQTVAIDSCKGYIYHAEDSYEKRGLWIVDVGLQSVMCKDDNERVF